MPRAVVLLSGGLDSAVTLALAEEAGFECHALTVDYGQRHAIEIEAARRLAQGCASHCVVGCDLKAIGGSALTGDAEVPKDEYPSPGIPVTYVPARNTIFLSLALGLAEVLGAEAIFLGANVVDYSGYPDCRPEYLRSFESLARLATKAGVEGRNLKVVAPLLLLDKATIVREAFRLRVDVAGTHSCYDPGAHGEPCGACDACTIRARAFADLGMSDPARGETRSEG
ncbi:MAG: 7-cyano-7-deazaguanine synthase QueC [Fimbriimonadaceae bacterium]|nr:7-cyano-7-deazaguanine synthase QueC [Fimbriimonadaceae bacterium]